MECEMRIAVIGSRDFNDYALLKQTLDEYSISVIISGGAKGADGLAQQYANEHSIECVVHLPQWSKYGKGAGIVRNKLIISDADQVIAFWDGVSKGTKSSIKFAEQANKSCMVVYYRGDSLDLD